MEFRIISFVVLLPVLLSFISTKYPGNTDGKPRMYYSDSSRMGRAFAKDPHVIFFQNRYLMYYSVTPYTDSKNIKHGLGIGIAESTDLIKWKRITDVNIDSTATYEAKGIGAPCARVWNNKVHLFYQTYGNRENDAICHAVSDDGIFFIRDETNPVFKPTGTWNCGRAIDAEVVKFKNRYLLYFATRDPDFKIQIMGVAAAPLHTDFSRGDWKQLTDHPILTPEYAWEGKCVEAPSVIEVNNELYMFYAGSYNNKPQQIGVAKSGDGIHWQKLSKEPFLRNGKPGEWNSSESGHPHIFRNTDGKTWLFYQGNNDNGKTWYLSNMEILWNKKGPYIKK